MTENCKRCQPGLMCKKHQWETRKNDPTALHTRLERVEQMLRTEQGRDTIDDSFNPGYVLLHENEIKKIKKQLALLGA